MDIKYLQLIEDINQTHSLTMSAQRLGYTQSALSHSKVFIALYSINDFTISRF